MKVSIHLEKGETREEAEELLYKAVTAQRNGNIHTDQFPDPAMEHMAEKMKKRYQEMLVDMVREINEEIDR